MHTGRSVDNITSLLRKDGPLLLPSFLSGSNNRCMTLAERDRCSGVLVRDGRSIDAASAAFPDLDLDKIISLLHLSPTVSA